MRDRKERLVFKLSEIRRKVRISGFRDTEVHENRKTKKEKHVKRDFDRALED